jgi:hypothetical protein
MGDSAWPGAEDPRPGASVGAGVGRQPHGCGGNGWKWHGVGHDPSFVDATSAHPNMLHVVEALLGGPVRPAMALRRPLGLASDSADAQLGEPQLAGCRRRAQDAAPLAR